MNKPYDLLFLTLSKSVHQIILIIDAATKKIEYLNHFQPGYSEEDVYGNELFIFVAPEFIEEYRKKLNRVKDDKIPQQMTIVGQSSVHATGKAWYRTDIIPIKNEVGLVHKILIVSEDITPIKLKEFELADNDAKVHAILNNTTDIICSINSDYQLIEFNKVFSQFVELGFKRTPKPGDPILNYIDFTKREKLIEIYKSVLSGEVITDIEFFTTTFGETLHFETRYHPIYSHEGTISGITIFSKNITKHIAQQEELKRALAEKEILLSEIHHRIKNNLALVSGMLELQSLKLSDNESIEALNSSRYRIKTTALVHELLYSNETFNQLSLHHYLNKLFNLLTNDSTSKLKLSGDNPILSFNTAMPLGLMLNELMMNSIKHSFQDKPIEVLVDVQTNNSELTITYAETFGEFPEYIVIDKSDSTGLTLIRTFAEQLNGSVNLIAHNPPKFLIKIQLDA